MPKKATRNDNPTVASIVEDLDRFAPPERAAEWDNVGLLLGERTAAVRRLMTCLTVTPESAREAVERDVQLIVTHHPILFRAVKRLTSDTTEGRMLLSLVRAGVAVYSPHTSFDNTTGGINDLLARRLGLQSVKPLRGTMGAKLVKIVVFVPDRDLGKVSDALFEAGAGHIGAYSECSFRLSGTGTFFGGEGSNPTVGQKGRREEAPEWRLEVVCPERQASATVAAMRKAHSYEEPAIDVYPLVPETGKVGEGRLGELAEAVALGDLAVRVRRELKSGPVQVVGEPDRKIRKVGIACGAGGEFLRDAARAGAEALLTGEARFHDYLDARARGVALVLPGHHATERCGVEDLADRLREKWPTLEVWASEREVDPVSWV
jgi:dinuclear metal center YbgI/SA1388 family protein